MAPREKRGERVRTTIYWRPELRDALKVIADEERRSLNDLVMLELEKVVRRWQQSKEQER